MDDVWYQDVAAPNLSQIQGFQRLMDQARVDLEQASSGLSTLDITDPRVLERLVYSALDLLGYEDLVADLRRAGRPKKGRFSRSEALRFMEASPEICLQYAYQLLPKTRKSRNKKKRVGKWPQYELTRAILFLKTHENLSVADAIRKCITQLDLPHDEKDLHSIYSKNISEVKNRKKITLFWLY